MLESWTYQSIGLPNFVWCLLQPALRSLDPTVTVVNVLLHVAQVVELEAPFRLLR